MDKVQTLEGVILLNATEQVNSAVLASIALDGGFLVDYGELGGVGGHGDGVTGNNADDGEEGALGLPALGAATGVVVSNIAAEGDLDLVRGAVAVELSTGKAAGAGSDAVVDKRVKRGSHCDNVYNE